MQPLNTEVKHNIAFEAHPELVLLQKMNEINIGYRHYSKQSAKGPYTNYVDKQGGRGGLPNVYATT